MSGQSADMRIIAGQDSEEIHRTCCGMEASKAGERGLKSVTLLDGCVQPL